MEGNFAQAIYRDRLVGAMIKAGLIAGPKAASEQETKDYLKYFEG